MKKQIKLQKHIYKGLLVNSLMAIIFMGLLSMLIYIGSESLAEGMNTSILLPG